LTAKFHAAFERCRTLTHTNAHRHARRRPHARRFGNRCRRGRRFGNTGPAVSACRWDRDKRHKGGDSLTDSTLITEFNVARTCRGVFPWRVHAALEHLQQVRACPPPRTLGMPWPALSRLASEQACPARESIGHISLLSLHGLRARMDRLHAGNAVNICIHACAFLWHARRTCTCCPRSLIFPPGSVHTCCLVCYSSLAARDYNRMCVQHRVARTSLHAALAELSKIESCASLPCISHMVCEQKNFIPGPE
jgi:hypothetical protein